MVLPKLNTHPVVLIGSSGTGTAFGAISAIRRHWSNDVTIVAMDINPPHLVTASLLADEFEQVPLSDDDAFPSVLLHLVERYRIDTYLPLVDVELARAAELRKSSLLPKEVCLLAPPEKSAHICFDKYLAACWMKQEEIPTPDTALASQPFEAEEYFLKPRKGFGSRGARGVKYKELESIPKIELESLIVQSICTEPEITVDTFYDPDRGFLRICCRERLETKSGVCTKARVFYDASLEDIAIQLAKGLSLSGTFCFQVMRSNSAWKVTDINARPGAGTAISVAIGLDFHGALFARAWGLDARPALPKITREHVVTRQYAEFVMF
jgi:carbamoylphosphate synthase large subunit